MKAPQRREREIARTREDIVDAASRAFVEIGVHDATMQDIAAEAGCLGRSFTRWIVRASRAWRRWWG